MRISRADRNCNEISKGKIGKEMEILLNWKIVLLYLLVINLAAFVMMGTDKKRAKRKEWRIPERALFGSALLGGSIGAIAGMYCFRHKTKHWYFVLGMPGILVIQIVLIGVLRYFG